MAKKAKLTEDKYIALCNNLNKEIENAYAAIKGLNSSYNALLKGDSEGPYWNGSTAKTFYTTAKRNLDNDITAYREAVEAWEKLRDRYAVLIRKGYFK